MADTGLHGIPFRPIVLLMKTLYVPSHLVYGVSVVYRQGSRFLLIKRKNPPFQHWFSFPGGRVNKGEDPCMAAKRELYEETGLTATRLVHFATLDLGKETKQQKSYFLSVYHALDISGTAAAADDAISLHWLSLAEMEQVPVIPSVYAIAKQLEQTIDKKDLSR